MNSKVVRLFSLSCLVLFIAALAGFEFSKTSAVVAVGRAEVTSVRVALKLYYSDTRGDNFTTATSDGERDARGAGYRYARTEGFLFSGQEDETVPLKLFYSDQRGDNFTTGTADGERDARASGYRYVRNEGYLYPEERSGLVPLKLFYSDARRDNFTTATADGERDARAAGYRYVRVEGYVFPGAAQDVGVGAVGNLNLAGSWMVTIESTGDELQGDWTRVDRWDFTNLGGNRWRVKMFVGDARTIREGEMSGAQMIEKTKTAEEIMTTINDGPGRFRLIMPHPKGPMEMQGTYSQSQFSVSNTSGGVSFTYTGRRP
jgi:hypothetical protein